jgi:hypothetical protein
MKERPILFSTPMVQAILEGRKTMTRRIVKPQPDARGLRTTNVPWEDWRGREVKCPYGELGDRLWLKETTCCVMLDHAPDLLQGMDSQTAYKASVHEDWIEYAKEKYGYKWTPSIYMPRSASRITLEITDVRVERLQDISEKDAKSEGAKDSISIDEMKELSKLNWEIKTPFSGHQFGFLSIWCKINGVESWEQNPWVWVISFKQV